MLSKRCVSTTHHGVLIYTPPKHTLSCVILRTKGVFGEHTMVCSGNTLVFTVCMESLDLTYNLIALKIKSKTLDRIYFMSQVFQEHS